MAVLIRALGFAAGVPCPHAGQFLESFDFDAHGGQGYGTFTYDLGRAKRFDTPEAALAFWKTPSRVRPTRPDGKPNRPLTALTITFVTVED